MSDAYLGKRLIAAARLARYEHRVETAIGRALARREQAVRTLALTAAAHPDAFDEAAWDTDLAEEIGPEVAAILEDMASVVVEFLHLPPDVRARILGRIDVSAQAEHFMSVIRGIGPDTAARILQALSAGTANGESIPQLTRRIDDVFGMARNRAALIARTETNRAANLVGFDAAGQIHAELPLTKTWLATNDARTRQDHADADGQTVGYDDQFDVGGEACDYPCDPVLSAEQSANCRCTTTFSAADEGDLTPAEQSAEEEAAAAAE